VAQFCGEGPESRVQSKPLKVGEVVALCAKGGAIAWRDNPTVEGGESQVLDRRGRSDCREWVGVYVRTRSELVASSKCELATFSCVSGPVQSSRPVVEVALRVPFCVSERQSGWIESGVAVALISVALMESD
jgi:hypothetical protein